MQPEIMISIELGKEKGSTRNLLSLVRTSALSLKGNLTMENLLKEGESVIVGLSGAKVVLNPTFLVIDSSTRVFEDKKRGRNVSIGLGHPTRCNRFSNRMH